MSAPQTVAEHVERCAAVYQGVEITPADPAEVRAAVMCGCLVSRVDGVASYEWDGHLYLISDHDLLESQQ